MAEGIESNGSFYVSRGTFKYTGLPPADVDQVVTFDYEKGEVNSTDLSKLQGNACVSQYTDSPPKKRPRGAELQIGDFWTDKNSKLLYIWDGDNWVSIRVSNGNPVGAIIQYALTDPLTSAPPGYLRCNGTPCPAQFVELLAILIASTGQPELPLIPGAIIKY